MPVGSWSSMPTIPTLDSQLMLDSLSSPPSVLTVEERSAAHGPVVTRRAQSLARQKQQGKSV